MTPAPQTSPNRPLWTALVVLAAALIGETAGLIASAGGADVWTAILIGGSAFTGAVATLLALAHFAGVTADR